jgi:tetratricopeptide (TPR) repeat protein
MKDAANFFPNGQARLKGQGTRRFMCDLALLLYHIALPSMIQIPGSNMPQARVLLAKQLESKPDSFLYLWFQSKSLMAYGKPTDAIEVLKKVVSVAKDWRQLAHVCFWDMAMCNLALGEWEKAAEFYNILLEENKWSKATYMYVKAICLYTADPKKYANDVAAMLKQVPSLCKKVAGKSVPIEKYISRKSRKFALQDNRLLLPAYEIMYMWSGFDLMPRSRIESCIVEFDGALKYLDAQQKVTEEPYKTFFDDLCLARFLKGVASRELVIPNSQLLLPEQDFVKRVVSNESKEALKYSIRQLEFIALQAESLHLDHWILPFSRYELGSLHVRLGDYETARREYNAALNGGYTQEEVGTQKVKVSMEQSLHLRTHNALVKVHIFITVD